MSDVVWELSLDLGMRKNVATWYCFDRRDLKQLSPAMGKDSAGITLAESQRVCMLTGQTPLSDDYDGITKTLQTVMTMMTSQQLNKLCYLQTTMDSEQLYKLHVIESGRFYRLCQ